MLAPGWALRRSAPLRRPRAGPSGWRAALQRRMTDLSEILRANLSDIRTFSANASGVRLRSYQQHAALSIVNSVLHKRGLSFVVIFPRQSGKNELQAQLETYLLTLFSRLPAEMVKVSPTWKPQTLNAMRRLERMLKRNLLTRTLWRKEQSYIYRVGAARIAFLSGAPTANVVGATANLLLECDEAQDVSIEKWDKEIAPMAASTNATRVFWGTAWTAHTLLSREKRLALAAEQRDGARRVFQITANEVRAEVPAYGKFVDGEIARHGRSSPYIRSQFFSEEIDEAGGMFTPERLALMQGAHPPRSAPEPGRVYAFALDVGGEDFAAGGDAAGRRDATALTVAEVDLSAADEELQLGPRLLARFRKQWVGLSHLEVFRQMSALVDLWSPQRVIVDATGVGEGLASLLLQRYGTMVTPFKFTQTAKSELGWGFIAAVESGRYKEHAPGAGAGEAERLQRLFWEQCRGAGFEVLPGPGRICRWGAPAAARGAAGEPLHDDLLLSAALAAHLLGERWGSAESAVIRSYDPLQDMQF